MRELAGESLRVNGWGLPARVVWNWLLKQVELMIFWLTQSHEMKEAGADNRLVEQLAGLGEAEFPLNLHASAMQIPWAFKEAKLVP
jgi:hypothetical protein